MNLSGFYTCPQESGNTGVDIFILNIFQHFFPDPGSEMAAKDLREKSVE
jgi:hypothetical protein